MTTCDCVCSHCFKDDLRIGHCRHCSWQPPLPIPAACGSSAMWKRRFRSSSHLWYWSGGVY